MNDDQKIIDYSKDKFLSEGFYKITMDEIASGLRMSKKTIYKFFPSKNLLVDATVKLFKAMVQKKLDSITKGEANSIIKIKRLTNLFAELSLKISPKMMEDLRLHRPELWQNIEDFRTKNIKKIWNNILDQGKMEGNIVNFPNDIIIEVILAAMQRIISPQFLLNNNLSIQHAFEVTFGMLINGILTDKGKKVYSKIEKESKNEND